MLLRSSSAPILCSLLHTTTTPFSDTSTTHHHHPFSCHFSDSTDHPPPSSVRRSRSDGNLHALLSDHPNDAHHHHHHPPPRSSSRLPAPIPETIPSFSVYHTTDLKEEVEEDMNDMDEVATTMERGFSFEKQNVRMATSPLFLVRGLGIDCIGSGLMNAGGGGDGGGGGGDGGGDGGGCYGGGEQSDIDAYYKRMIDENPSNAQFLYQKRGDIQRAEEYYSRAILLDPGDGEIMSHYAKLVWELHGDEERASSYFERAVQAAPLDSHDLASYAGFLWEVEDEDCAGELGDGKLQNYVGSFQYGILASAT